MAELETLKSYLVSLGFAVNQPELRRFDQALKEAAGMVSFRTGGILGQVLQWNGAITGAFLGVSTGVLAMADHVAQADQKYRLLGQRMFMTTEQARKLSIGMDALGASLEEIAWDPELNKRFLELSELQDKLAKGLGANFSEDMEKIRDLRFEFTKLQVSLQYLSFKFVSTLFEKMGVNAENAGEKIEQLTKWITDRMPEAAGWLANQFVPILKDTWEITKSLGGAFGEAGNAATNLMLALTGHGELASAEFSLKKLEVAVHGMADEAKGLVLYLSGATEEVAHLANAVTLAQSGQWKQAGGELGKSLGPAKKDGATPLPPAVTGAVDKYVDTANQAGAWFRLLVDNALGRTRKPAGGSAPKPVTPTSTAPTSTGAPATAAPTQAASGAVASTGTIAEQARVLARQAGAELGIDPKLVFEQWSHETGDFTNRGARKLNNLAGIRLPGSLAYRVFDTLEDFEKFYVRLLGSNKRYTKEGILNAKTEEEFAGALKRGGYYEGIYQNYVDGMKRFGRGLTNEPASGGSVGQNVQIRDIHVQMMQPNLSMEDIQRSMAQGIRDAIKREAQSNIAQLGYAGG